VDPIKFNLKRLVFTQLLLFAQLIAAEQALSPSIPNHGETSIPYGFDEFCKRFPIRSECQPNTSAKVAKKVEFSPELFKIMNQVSAKVNKEVTPLSDRDHFNEEEVWDYPDQGGNKGDCEDYALLKRARLIGKGLKPENMSFAVVKDQDGNGHLILIVHTTKGDFALDNLTNEVKIWYKTGYQFVKYQDPRNPYVWISAKPKNPVKSSQPQHKPDAIRDFLGGGEGEGTR
jgi:predicted transglutaminase-like cysteine proteinase